MIHNDNFITVKIHNLTNELYYRQQLVSKLFLKGPIYVGIRATKEVTFVNLS